MEELKIRQSASCSEKACPFPAAPMLNLCMPHVLVLRHPGFFAKAGAHLEQQYAEREWRNALKIRLDHGPRIEWTPERLRLLHWIWESHGVRGQIASRIRLVARATGIHESAIQSAGYRLGLAKPKWAKRRKGEG